MGKVAQQITMTYEILIGALGLIGLLAVVVKPLINLNSNITALTSSVNQLKDVLTDLKERVTNHGKEIDGIKDELADHEARLRLLEK
jgi:predicted  nucleic acid-binding Zn-ribbon protein